jgi:carboxyl-terminal processing protease
MRWFKKLAATCCCSFAMTFVFAQLPADQQKAIVLKRMIERNHYSPRPVNDSFSSFVFNTVLESVDPGQYLLTASEFQQLNAWRYKIDDELSGANSWGFVNLLTTLYRKALNRADSITNGILRKPLDFSIADKGRLGEHPSDSYPANANEMQVFWTKYFKWELLNAAYDIWLTQKPGKTFKEILQTNEKLLREKYSRLNHAELSELANDVKLKDKILEAYLSAVSNGFDPHTEFLSNENKIQFEQSLSTDGKSFGFLVDEKDGKVLVTHLIPGGPAWKCGELHKNDQVLQLVFANRDPVDVSMISPSEVFDMIASPPSENLLLKTKRPDGTIHTISLKTDVVSTEENSVKGYVLNGSKKIGYISLPDFYTVWEEGSGSSCAGDVSKELVNLKKEGIEALILDVRYNGGGSLDEALQLIGIFINEGPLVGINERTGKPAYLKDPNRGTIYDGPMLVLINGESASASEALAGCLQDYNRAVIAGSRSYGKGSMQQIYTLDTTTNDRTASSAAGFAKITMGKFFRLNGTTVQLKGVEPDIILPDAFDAVDRRESSVSQILPSDTIKKNNYYQPLKSLPVAELKQASAQRIAVDPGFVEVQKWIKLYRDFNSLKMHTVPLKAELFEKWRAQYEIEGSHLAEKPAAASQLFKVSNHKYESQLIQNNPYAKEINLSVIKNLEQDIYIEESFRILSDLMQKTKQ